MAETGDSKRGQHLENIISKLSKEKPSASHNSLLLISGIDCSNAVLSLLSEGDSENDEPDLHQCGKCRKMFTSLERYLTHKADKSCPRWTDQSQTQQNDVSTKENDEVSEALIETRPIIEREETTSSPETDIMMEDSPNKRRKGKARKLHNSLNEYDEPMEQEDSPHSTPAPSPISILPPTPPILHPPPITMPSPPSPPTRSLHVSSSSFPMHSSPESYCYVRRRIRIPGRKGLGYSAIMPRHPVHPPPEHFNAYNTPPFYSPEVTPKISSVMSAGLPTPFSYGEAVISASYNPNPEPPRLFAASSMDAKVAVQPHHPCVENNEVATSTDNSSFNEIPRLPSSTVSSNASSGSCESDESLECLIQTVQNAGIVDKNKFIKDDEYKETDIAESFITRPRKNQADPNQLPDIITDAPAAKRLCANSTFIKPSGEKIYRCSECHKEFSFMSRLKRHLLVHTGERPFHCPECPQKFTQAIDLKRHRLRHADQKPFKCQVCGKNYTRADRLKVHIASHTDEEIRNPSKYASDEFDDYSFNEENDYFDTEYDDDNVGIAEPSEDHVMNVHPSQVETRVESKPFRCSRCNLDFVQAMELVDHVCAGSEQVTTVVAPVPISAPVSIPPPSLAPVHVSVIKQEISALPKEPRVNGVSNDEETEPSTEETADADDEEYVPYKSLKIKTKPGAENKPYKCPKCSGLFSKASTLKTHLLKHSGQKPFKCDRCSKTFFSSSSLKIHFRIHTGDKPFKCNDCDKAFSDPSNFNKHKRSHIKQEKENIGELLGKNLKLKQALNDKDLRMISHPDEDLDVESPEVSRSNSDMITPESLNGEHAESPDTEPKSDGSEGYKSDEHSERAGSPYQASVSFDEFFMKEPNREENQDASFDSANSSGIIADVC